MTPIIEILYGSQNYGLSDKNSDYDYKVIVLPSYDDLYYERTPRISSIYDLEHYSGMDIRKWINLLKRGNFNAIEYLFSTSIKVLRYEETIQDFLSSARLLYTEKQYCKKVWPYLFSSTYGMAFQAFKRNGDNRKTASRAYWCKEFLLKIVQNNFNIPECWGNDMGARKIRYGSKEYDFEKIFSSFQDIDSQYRNKANSLMNFDKDFDELNFLIKKQIYKNMELEYGI